MMWLIVYSFTSKESTYKTLSATAIKSYLNGDLSEVAPLINSLWLRETLNRLLLNKLVFAAKINFEIYKDVLSKDILQTC